MTPGRVLVLGCNGFVGNWLARELAENGWEVFGSDMAPTKVHETYAAYEPCNILDLPSLTTMLSRVKPNAVVNLAAVSSVGASWRNPQLTVEVNVVGTLNVLEAVRSLPTIPRVLFVGSSEEYAPSNSQLCEDDALDAANPYGISKAAHERLALIYGREWGVPVCLTRSFNHTGPGQQSTFVLPSWCMQAARIQRSGVPGVLRVGNLHVERDFSDVRDVCHAYRLLLESNVEGEVFNVGSGIARPLGELARRIASFPGVEVRVEVDPALVRSVDVPRICADVSKIKKQVGWEPVHELDQTLREMYEAFLSHEE